MADGPLDAYSRTVVSVADAVRPSVLSVMVRSTRGEGAGSAVAFTEDGFLLTSAHVVEGTGGGAVVTSEGEEAPFEVVCQRSGVTVTVPPGQSILDALEEQGVSVLSSCQEGVCGTCETRVLGGIPDHRDSLLSEEEREENEYMMVCVSRAKSDRLVLDL